VQAGLWLSEGRAAKAIDSLERADRLADGSSQAAASLGYTLARQGQTAPARAVLQRLESQSASRGQTAPLVAFKLTSASSVATSCAASSLKPPACTPRA